MRRAAAYFLTLLALGLPAPVQAAVDVYFLQGEQVAPVERAGSTVEEAVQALLAGPTREEALQQFETYIPKGTPLRGVTLENGVATVDLGERFAIGFDGEELSARITQLVYTVTAVTGVERVQVLVKGGTPLGLFPGYSLTKPVTLADVERPIVPPPVSPEKPAGKPDAATRELQRLLADLGYLATEGVDGIYGEQTHFAVIAFQKWEGLSRDGVAGQETLGRLVRATRQTPIRTGAGRRIQVLLDRQLALLIEEGVALRTIHVSTGASGTETPAGSFSVFRKEERSWPVPFQVWLPWASYFVGGIAFHEYPDVPTSPVSHGCVRIPRYDARGVYEFAPIGTPVIVIASSR